MDARWARPLSLEFTSWPQHQCLGSQYLPSPWSLTYQLFMS